MSLTICPLASGSSGNAIYIGDDKNRILIDCGLSGKRIEKLLQSRDIACPDLDGIILTHEHTDHIKGAGVMARRWGLPVYTRPGTWSAGEEILENIPSAQQKLLLSGLSFGRLEIDFFPISHDAREPVGLLVRRGSKQVALVTDLGESSVGLEGKIYGSDALIIEANHDPDMLATGPYPFFLQQRIKSSRGHLSNDDCGFLLSRVLNSQQVQVYLAHLSQDNNEPSIARITVENILREQGVDAGVDLHVAERNCASRPSVLL